jgi:hypothetical protein
MKELHVYDFDGTLYNSPLPPDGNPAWWLYTKSLDGAKAPGFDSRWRLPIVIQARRSMSQPGITTILVTGRPDYREMRNRIAELMSDASLPFRYLFLKPPSLDITTPDYKAAVITTFTDQDPEYRKVVVWDDDDKNHKTIRKHLEQRGVKYEGILVR